MNITDEPIMPFGKYKNQPISVLASDPQYCDWLASQDWFRSKHNDFYTIIINNFQKPEDTPEHNKLQAKFTDSCFVAKFVRCVFGVDKNTELEKAYKCKAKAEKTISEISDGTYDKNYSNQAFYDAQFYLRESKKYIDSNCDLSFSVEFEHHGWDVFIFIRGCFLFCGFPEYNDIDRAFVEVKPQVGDDYPSVLRQMKANMKGRTIYDYNPVLLYSDFTATGITLEEMKKIFASSGIRVVCIHDVESEIKNT